MSLPSDPVSQQEMLQQTGYKSESEQVRRGRIRWAGITPILLCVVFLIALVLAANNNTVLGWIIALIALGWLIFATVVYVGVSRVARFGAEQIRAVQEVQLQKYSQSAEATQVVDEPVSDGVRDMKLDHSFKIIQVQTRVITEELTKGLDDPKQTDQDTVARALETIEITANNARDMLKD